jgi:hypothetical protein
MQEFPLDRNGFRMTSILKLYLDIALLRRGPEDVPVSRGLLFWTVVAYFALSVMLVANLGDASGGVLPVITGIAIALGWFRFLLARFGRSERFLQAMSAYFGFSLLFRLASAPLVGALAPYADKPQELPTALMLLAVPVSVYQIFVAARILRAAIERPMLVCVALLIVQSVLEFVVATSLLGLRPGDTMGSLS